MPHREDRYENRDRDRDRDRDRNRNINRYRNRDGYGDGYRDRDRDDHFEYRDDKSHDAQLYRKIDSTGPFTVGSDPSEERYRLSNQHYFNERRGDGYDPDSPRGPVTPLRQEEEHEKFHSRLSKQHDKLVEDSRKRRLSASKETHGSKTAHASKTAKRTVKDLATDPEEEKPTSSKDIAKLTKPTQQPESFSQFVSDQPEQNILKNAKKDDDMSEISSLTYESDNNVFDFAKDAEEDDEDSTVFKDLDDL